MLPHSSKLAIMSKRIFADFDSDSESSSLASSESESSESSSLASSEDESSSDLESASLRNETTGDKAIEDEAGNSIENQVEDGDEYEEMAESEHVNAPTEAAQTGPQYKYKCPGCPLSFRKSESLLNHRRKELGIKPYACTWPDCNHSTRMRRDIMKHIRMVHFKVPMSKVKELAQNGTLDERDPNEFIQRDDRYLQPDYTRQKNNKKKGPFSSSKDKPKSKSHRAPLKAASVDKRKVSTKHLPCYFNQFGVCDSFFRSKKSRQVHYRTHLSIRPYYCTYPGCKDFRAVQHSAVYVHIRKDHFGLPATTKEQKALRIKDRRDHRKYVGVTKELLHPCFCTMPESIDPQSMEE